MRSENFNKYRWRQFLKPFLDRPELTGVAVSTHDFKYVFNSGDLSCKKAPELSDVKRIFHQTAVRSFAEGQLDTAESAIKSVWDEESWYYTTGSGNRVGPFSYGQFADLYIEGAIERDTYVYTPTKPNWFRVKTNNILYQRLETSKALAIELRKPKKRRRKSHVEHEDNTERSVMTCCKKTLYTIKSSNASIYAISKHRRIGIICLKESFGILMVSFRRPIRLQIATVVTEGICDHLRISGDKSGDNDDAKSVDSLSDWSDAEEKAIDISESVMDATQKEIEELNALSFDDTLQYGGKVQATAGDSVEQLNRLTVDDF